MGLNVSKGNMYGFVTHTWNTIKGECPHGCSYCYCKRFGPQRPVHFDERELKTNLGEGNFIFVGSSCDMWAIDIPTEWIKLTIHKCLEHKNNYLFQSKNPGGFLAIERYSLCFKPIICTTIETNRAYPFILGDAPNVEERTRAMMQLERFPRFVTIEPIMDFDLGPMVELIKHCEPEQVNIGADSGRNGLPEPSRGQVLELIEALEKFTRVERKRNLARITEAK